MNLSVQRKDDRSLRSFDLAGNVTFLVIPRSFFFEQSELTSFCTLPEALLTILDDNTQQIYAYKEYKEKLLSAFPQMFLSRSNLVSSLVNIWI